MGKKDKDKKFKVFFPHKGVRSGELVRKENTTVEYTVLIDLTGDVFIGKYSQISHETIIYTHKHKWSHSRGRRQDIQKVIPVSLFIGEDVFIGVRSMLIGVSTIGKGAVIGAGSVVTKSIPAYEIWAGNPAKKIGERIDED